MKDLFGEIVDAASQLFNFCAQRRSDVGFEKEGWRMIQEGSAYLNWDGGI
jgi:hypothetical protein